ncbi:hypothetical protein P3T76_015511 [Phytophthora citrophthora]|uniref:Uncharacterized protein n=1 Tax=Phytophthora citrophthora TaxID=4793 RepID=A0AAD9FZV2_9STRA|nr:hypothetical protein P3T76_015511 [Phytophthora citrophthora]
MCGFKNMKMKRLKCAQLRHEIEVMAADLRRKVQEDIAEFYPRNWTLEVVELPGIHDGEVIARALSKLMENRSLMREYCTCILSDSEPNVVKAAQLLIRAVCLALPTLCTLSFDVQ